MTREEAKEIMCKVTFYWELGEQTLTQNQIDEAIDLAIKALEQQPCEDCISRQAVLNTLFYKSDNNCEVVLNKELQDRIKALPPVTPQPKIGHWIKTPKAVMGEGYMWYCNNCEHQVYQDSSRGYPSEKYCPNCGAKMAESEDKTN